MVRSNKELRARADIVEAALISKERVSKANKLRHVSNRTCFTRGDLANLAIRSAMRLRVSRRESRYRYIAGKDIEISDAIPNGCLQFELRVC